MGLMKSTQFKRNDDIPGQGKALLLMAKRLGLRTNEVNRLYVEFLKHQRPGTHEVDLPTLLSNIRMEGTLMLSVIYNLFDENKSSSLNFMEFMIILWGLLSSDDESIARLCFGLFDINNSKVLDIAEVKYMIHVIWQFNPSYKCSNNLNKLNDNKDSTITLPEFLLFDKYHPKLLKPLRSTIQTLRSKLPYRGFWTPLVSRRAEKFSGQNLFELLQGDRHDARCIEASLRYLNLRTDAVPPHFVQQWEYIQRKKLNRGAISKQMPYELVEQKLPLVRSVIAAYRGRRSTMRMNSGNKVAVSADALTEEELVLGKREVNADLEDLKQNESID